MRRISQLAVLGLLCLLIGCSQGGNSSSNNQAPNANDDAFTVAAGLDASLDLSASDADGDPLTWRIVSLPANGTLTGAGPNCTYTPDPGYTGPDSFTFEVSDGEESSSNATVTITVVNVWFVDLNAGGVADGTSWADALAHPQDGNDLANPGDQVWVAAGNYVWVAGFQVLLLSSDVAIYGGFDGTESCLEQRDYTNNVTTLNGDTDGNGTGDVSRVVQIPWTVTNARLDGFTITKGNANGGGVDARGGGFLTQGLTNVTVANCIVTDNFGNLGGGMNDEQSDGTLVFQNVIFSNNTGGNGGAVYLWNGSAPTFDGVTFIENTTTGSGGALYLVGATATIGNSMFIGNSAAGPGGGIYSNASTLTVSSCEFSGNQSQSGGGIYNISTNSDLTNLTLSGNSAIADAGGIYNNNSSPVITNSVFWANLAAANPEIFNLGASAPTVTYSNVQGGYPGAGNIDADPLFVDADGADDTVGTDDDDLTPSAGSPLIDAGDGSVAPATDIDNSARMDDPATVDTGTGTPAFTDIGAYEFQP
jgi:predicted outer membrane repeat protein